MIVWNEMAKVEKNVPCHLTDFDKEITKYFVSNIAQEITK